MSNHIRLACNRVRGREHPDPLPYSASEADPLLPLTQEDGVASGSDSVVTSPGCSMRPRQASHTRESPKDILLLPPRSLPYPSPDSFLRGMGQQQGGGGVHSLQVWRLHEDKKIMGAISTKGLQGAGSQRKEALSRSPVVRFPALSRSSVHTSRLSRPGWQPPLRV